MPEPITLIVIGAAVWAMMKPKPVVSNPPQQALAAAPAAMTADNRPLSDAGAGTGADAPLANPTSIANQGVAPIGTALIESVVLAPEDAPPSDLVAALDNQTALAMRAYAALNPADFQAWLDRYADRIQLRNDMYLEALTDPPEGGYELSPAQMVSLGSASYKVLQALNGVYVGKSVDLFGVSASLANQIPGINPDLVSGLQAAAMGYRVITSMSQVLSIASTNGVSVMNFTGMVAGGAYPGLAALPLSGVLMAVGLVVDIGFTIIGDKPDLQKAIDVALDVASLACLFIPVIGVVIAIVIQLVKFIIDLFGDDLFGGGMSHEQREILEAARYGANLNPMFAELSNDYTPRELFWSIVRWGSGYCGGTHVVAMSINLILKAGDQLMVGGQLYTVPADTYFGFGNNEQPGGCYWIKSTPFANITNDEQAWALGVYGPTNGIIAGAQVGISEAMQVQFEDPTQRLIQARTLPMRDFLIKYRMTLDQIDQIALEYRAQPHLKELANGFGFETWQEFFAWVVQDEWRQFSLTVTNATLSDFCRMNGYPTMYAFRARALADYESYFYRVQVAGQRLYQNALDAQRQQLEALMLTQQQMSMSAP